jgi:OmpA-OmpF porin, OOP family
MTRRWIVLALLLMTVPAAAADIHKGPYFGAGIGNAAVDGAIASTDFSGNDTSWKAIGGWRFLQFLAAEADWIDFGNIEDKDVKVDITGFEMSGLGILPFGKHFELFAKAGLASWHTRIDSSSPHSSDNGNDGMYGAGAAFRLGESLQIRVEYERFDIPDTDKVEFASASATFTF